MKINLAKLQKVEASYGENPISLFTLQNMLDIVLHQGPKDNEGYSVAGYQMAYASLKDLGIIDMENSQPIQLNS